MGTIWRQCLIAISRMAEIYFGYNYFVDIYGKNIENNFINPPWKLTYCKFVRYYGCMDFIKIHYAGEDILENEF